MDRGPGRRRLLAGIRHAPPRQQLERKTLATGVVASHFSGHAKNRLFAAGLPGRYLARSVGPKRVYNVPYFAERDVNTLARHWGFSLYDADGTLTGAAGQSIIYDHRMMRSDGDIQLPTWQNAAVSKRRFGHLKVNPLLFE